MRPPGGESPRRSPRAIRLRGAARRSGGPRARPAQADSRRTAPGHRPAGGQRLAASALDVFPRPRGPGRAHPRLARAGGHCLAAQPSGRGAQRRMTAVAARETATTTERKGIDRGVLAVFAGLMLGSLFASLDMTLVAPAPPAVGAQLVRTVVS